MKDERVGVGVGIVVYNTDGSKIAMVHRAADATHGGDLWALPGGWVDFGETPEDAVRREIVEETGLVVGSPHFIGIQTNTHDNLHVINLTYSCEWLNGAIENREPDKHDYAGWVSVKSVRDFLDGGLLFPACVDLFNEYPELLREYVR